MKKIHCSCWLILFLLTALWSSAQTPKIDSLKKELIRNSVSDRYDVLWGLAYELFDVDNLQATGYAKEAHQAALASGDTLDIVMSGRILGQLFRRVDKVDESIDVLNFVLPISKGWKLNGEIKKILTALAVSYAFKGEFDKALEANLECLIIRQVENNNKEVSISFNNLGVLFSSLEDYSLSLNYYLKSLDLKMELADEDKVDMDLLLVNIALDYMEINDYANADLYFDKAVKYCSPLCRPTIVIPVEFGLGKLLIKQGNYFEAKKHIIKSLRLSMDENYKYYELANLAELAEIALVEGDLTNALDYLNKAQLLVNEDRHKDLAIEIYRLSSDYYSKIGDNKRTNFFLRKYLKLKENMFDARMRADFMALQIQFSQKENLQRIDSQSKILMLQNDAIQKQKLLNFSYGGIAVLTIGVTLLLFKSNRQKHKINKVLDHLVAERTLELAKNRDALQHAHDERAVILKRILSDSLSYLATMKGLSYAATKDLPEEHAIYFRQVELTTEKLVFDITKYAPNYQTNRAT